MVEFGLCKERIPEDFITTQELKALEDKAQRLEEMIKIQYVFEPEKTQKVLHADGTSFEYITCDRVWHARYPDRSFDVKCTAERIFSLLMGEYLVSTGHVDRYSNDLMTLWEIDVQQEAYVYSYFKRFIDRVERAE